MRNNVGRKKISCSNGFKKGENHRSSKVFEGEFYFHSKEWENILLFKEWVNRLLFKEEFYFHSQEWKNNAKGV